MINKVSNPRSLDALPDATAKSNACQATTISGPPRYRKMPASSLDGLPSSHGRGKARSDGQTQGGDETEPSLTAGEDGAGRTNGIQAGSPPETPPPVPPVAQDFSNEPWRESIYAQMRASLHSYLGEATMAKLYNALSVIDETKLALAIQTFDMAKAIELREGRELITSFYTNLPLTLPEGTVLEPQDLLVQLQCFFFFPFRTDWNISDYDLIKGCVRLGMKSHEEAEIIVGMIFTANDSHALLAIKKTIDVQVARQQNKPASLTARRKSLVMTEMGEVIDGKLDRVELEKLCDAFWAIDNPAMVELAVLVSQASSALSIAGERSLVNMHKSGMAYEPLMQTVGRAFEQEAAMEASHIADIKQAVDVIIRLYFPYRKSATEFATDSALLKDIVALARDARLATIDTDVIVDNLQRLESPSQLIAMLEIVKRAMRLNKRFPAG